MKKLLTMLLLATIIRSAGQAPATIERLDKSLNAIISNDAKIEVIAEGFKWSEGPLWLDKQQALLFSDIPSNAIFKWTRSKGKELYLQPSGYTGAVPRGGEMGSNALLLDKAGKLVMCQHGNRQMARMDASLDKPAPSFTTIAGAYDSKKLNSPNDAVYRSNGDLFFTDPPYGLEKNVDDSLKELPYQGVYMVNTKGKVSLLTDSITRPNGIAFLPGEKTLLIGNSDGDNPFIYAFQLSPEGALSRGRIFCNGADLPVPEKGGFDGIKVDPRGNVFASGPGGICIFNITGKMIGRIRIPGRNSNCAFADNFTTLYITADMKVLRVKLR